ncbi:hypothetical protein Tco_0436535 [Tanacetum coccineum]
MNPQETQQVAARDKKWVPFIERVKISSTNIRLETTMPQKEETFQVVIDLIKNSSCFKAFSISKDVLEIFMQQFWYTVKKVQGTDSYEFILANKKCIVNPKVFRTILDICLRVEGVNFTDVPDDDTTLAFHIELGYKAIRILSNVHQIFIKYSTSQISPKKSRGKGSKGKRTADTPVIDVDVAEVSEPELSRKRTTSKSISITKAKEEAARKVHATHARIVTELVLEPTRRRQSGKLLKSRKTSRRQPGTRGSSEGTGTILGILDESTVVSTTSSEGTSAKPGVPDEENVISKEKLFLSGEMNKKKDYEELTDAAKADVEKKEEVKDAAKKAELPLTSSSLSVSSVGSATKAKEMGERLKRRGWGGRVVGAYGGWVVSAEHKQTEGPETVRVVGIAQHQGTQGTAPTQQDHRPTPLPEYPTRDFTMSTSSL